eukprot:TRINITY_DN11231_c0_g1_i1.p1 TRINITY_DN11231_c0_g1~~TRINITY_DN11231_c0_g1_i1.p1  ORF type:complete len:235 (-),score=27.86 TRINITY_DN11231_c0_g1_i1:157-861(-)
MAFEPLVERLRVQLAKSGLDIVHPFQVGWYNRQTPKHPLPSFLRQNTLGILVGNTKAIWNPFINHLKTKKTLSFSPLDSFTESCVSSVLKEEEASLQGVKVEVRYVWDMSPDRFVAFQHLAHHSGAAYFNKNAYLNIHQDYGAWIAWRACIVLDMDGPSEERFVELANPCPEADSAILEKLQTALNDKTNDWRKWVEMRDTCPIGKEYRYSEEQMIYHYDSQQRHRLLQSLCGL